MNKRELKNIPVPDFPRYRKSPNSKIEYVYSAKIIPVTGQKILVVTFYKVRTKSVEFRVFSDGTNFITQKFDPDKWSEACVINLLPYYYAEKVTADSKASGKIGVDYFSNGKPNTLEALIAYQAKIREKEYKAREEKIRISTQSFMNMIKDLPKDLERWIHNVPLKASRYIYYKRYGKIIEGYCTNCRQDVVVKKAKHNEKGRCPACRSQITYKAIGISRRVRDHSFFAILQRGEGHLHGAIIIRCFYVYREFGQHYRSPETRFSEDARYIISNKQLIMFKYESVFNRFYHRYTPPDWHRKKQPEIFQEYYLYTRNLKHVLKDTSWQYCAIKEFAQHIGPFNVISYLQTYIRHPAIEYMVKLKLYKLVSECLTYHPEAINLYGPEAINLYGRSLKEVLGVGKEDLPFIQKYDLSDHELSLFRMLKNKGYRLSPEVLQWVRKNLRYYTYEKDLIAYLTEYTTPERVVRYVTRQMQKCQYHYAHFTMRDWLDYLENAKKLDYDLRSNSILFPKDLRTAHDRVIELIKKKEEAIHDESIKEQEAELNELYGYEKGGYIVRAPKGVDEIIAEGAALNHCVGTYISRIARRETTVLFLREAANPDKPFYTIEVKDGNVRQVRGLNNCEATPEVKKFMAKWEKTIKARITKRKKSENQVRIMISA